MAVLIGLLITSRESSMSTNYFLSFYIFLETNRFLIYHQTHSTVTKMSGTNGNTCYDRIDYDRFFDVKNLISIFFLSEIIIDLLLFSKYISISVC